MAEPRPTWWISGGRVLGILTARGAIRADTQGLTELLAYNPPRAAPPMPLRDRALARAALPAAQPPRAAVPPPAPARAAQLALLP